MFITNNYDSLHLWWHENFVQHQNVSKYYAEDCLKNFILLYISELTASIAKTSHFLAQIYFIFLEIVIHQLQMLSIPNFDLSEKIGKSSSQVNEIFAPFCKLVALVLD